MPVKGRRVGVVRASIHSQTAEGGRKNETLEYYLKSKIGFKKKVKKKE